MSLAEADAVSSGSNALESLHQVTKQCLDGKDVFSVTWLYNKMPPQTGGDQVRYKLESYKGLKETLSDDAIKVLKGLGFGALLEINMHKFFERNFAIWAASLCKPAMYNNEDAIVFVLDEDCPRVMTRHEVAILIGLPMGNQTVPEELLENKTSAEVKDSLKSALKTASENKKDGQWSMADVIKACEQAKTRADHMLQVRLFIAAIFEFGIFTSASNYLSAENLGHVYDIKELVETDWCKKLIDHMQKCLRTFDDTKRVFSPLTFTLFFLENIDYPLPNAVETPRMKYYTEEKFRDIVAACKAGVKLKDWKDTVFGRKINEKVQASDIIYVQNYKEAVKKRKVFKEGKDLLRVLKENKGVSKKRPKGDETNKNDQFFRDDIDSDILHFYKENVVERTRDKIVLNILNHQVSELNYVECFKKKGYMHSSIMFMQCALWNEEWKEKAIDRVVLSYEAMLELSGQKEGQSTLASELLNRDLELQANLSREPVICQILVTLKQLLPPDYNSEVLEVQQQKNNYDCGFHVLLYINGFDDKTPEQICGVTKDMVDKCRIETSVHLRRHKLNKPAAIIDDVDDDDSVVVLENKFSYDNCRFNAALHGEEENHELSDAHLFMENELGGFYLDDIDMGYNVSDVHTREMEMSSDGAAGSSIPDDVSEELDNPRNLESNVDGKETGSTMAQVNKRRQTKPSQEKQPEDTSGVMKSRTERQIAPPEFFTQIHDRRSLPFVKFEVLENAYNLAINEPGSILKIKDISMTGPQLEKCFQGGQDARDLIIIFMEFLEQIKTYKRIFVSPFDKDDENLEEKIQGGLNSIFNKRDKTRTSTSKPLQEPIIYFPVFFSGEWIVVSFLFLKTKQQTHVYCHNGSFQEVREFALRMRDILSKALKERGILDVTFPQEKVARTHSSIKASDSAIAAMYFIKNLCTPKSDQLKKFETENDELRDQFMKRVKFETVQYLLCNKKNRGEVPDTVLQLLRKDKSK